MVLHFPKSHLSYFWMPNLTKMCILITGDEDDEEEDDEDELGGGTKRGADEDDEVRIRKLLRVFP